MWHAGSRRSAKPPEPESHDAPGRGLWDTLVCRYLDRLGVPYTYHDMEYEPVAAQQVRWWTGGSFCHPTVQVGGHILVEPSLDELDWALNRAVVI